MSKFKVLKITVLLMILFAICTQVTAKTLEDVFSNKPDIMKQLLSGGLVISDSVTEPNILLLPSNKWVLIDTEKFSMEKGGFFAEALSFIPYPESIANKSLEDRTVQVINSLREVSSQEGLTYISHRNGDKPAVLISKSFVTDKVGSKKKLPDPVLDTLPAKIVDIVFQSDTSFFGNYYQYDYSIFSNIISIRVRNMTTLSVFGIFPAIKKEKYTASVIIEQLETGMLVYSYAEVIDRKPVVSLLGYEIHLPSAINRRWTSVHNWFRSQIDKIE
ncbi:MAG: hypothetical protein HQ557_00760 [Bacteroidetes bacterium]|nr:hypothetical protein [Bacteroidota bacterium]